MTGNVFYFLSTTPLFVYTNNKNNVDDDNDDDDNDDGEGEREECEVTVSIVDVFVCFSSISLSVLPAQTCHFLLRLPRNTFAHVRMFHLLLFNQNISICFIF